MYLNPFIKRINPNIRSNFHLSFFIRPCRSLSFSHVLYKHSNNDDDDDTDKVNLDNEDEEYVQLRNEYFGTDLGHNCYIIHPYIKWGPKKQWMTTPEKQIQEAESLVRTLAPWKVYNKSIISVDTLDRKALFGKGNLEKLRKIIRSNKAITAVFVNVSTLTNLQIRELEVQFHVPIYDRYRIVMQILKLHAISKHAKLQVALAEVFFMWKRIEYDTKLSVHYNPQTYKMILRNRETKIKNEIKNLRTHRELLRSNRRTEELPTVAVVGYTNSGKTSLIKCLTGARSLTPKDQLFATLDVTVHEGLLPSYMKVLYVDTVGFIGNVPAELMECFIATLEDAMFADVVIHVEDISSEDHEFQRKHVVETLNSLSVKMGAMDKMKNIITVANKSDLIDLKDVKDPNVLPISAETGLGLSKLLNKIEIAVIESTGRQCISFKLPTGGDEIRWLYKNATVVSTEAVESDNQLQRTNVIITVPKLKQFKYQYLDKMKQ